MSSRIEKALRTRNRAAVREAVAGNDYVVPRSLRLRFWKTMLLNDDDDDFPTHAHLQNVKLDLPNQRVIRADSERTRADVDAFRSPEMRHCVSRLLTLYCKTNNVRYKQGLNEVVAPWFLVCAPNRANETVVYRLFDAFVAKFLPRMFADDEFHVLQGELALFKAILLFHDPELALTLDAAEVVPELYATPWFLTMFSMHLPVDALFKLWELYVVTDNRLLHVFVVAAFVISNRDALLISHPSDLPVMLTSQLSYHRRRQFADTTSDLNVTPLHKSLLKCAQRAIELFERTPDLTKAQLSSLLFDEKCLVDRAFLDELDSRLTLQCGGNEASIDLRDPIGEFLVVDVRPKSEFNSKRLKNHPRYVRFDPRWTQEPGALSRKLGRLKELPCERLCVLSTSSEDSTRLLHDLDEQGAMAVLHLLQRYFPRVCVIKHGIESFVEFEYPDLLILESFEFLPYANDALSVDRRTSPSNAVSGSSSFFSRMKSLRYYRKTSPNVSAYVAEAFEDDDDDDQELTDDEVPLDYETSSFEERLAWENFPFGSNAFICLHPWRFGPKSPQFGLEFFDLLDAITVLLITPEEMVLLKRSIDIQDFAEIVSRRPKPLKPPKRTSDNSLKFLEDDRTLRFESAQDCTRAFRLLR